MLVGNQVGSMSGQAFWKNLKELDLEAIAHQLIQDGWTRQQAMYAISCYKMFLFLVYQHPHMLLVPTQEIDRVWHCHILYTRKYFQDCQMLFGRFIHHEPGSQQWRQTQQFSLDAAFAQTQALFDYYFPLVGLGDTQLEQLDGIEQDLRIRPPRACLQSPKFSVGAKHLGDKSSVKPQVLCPNASPFQGLKTRPSPPNLGGTGFTLPKLGELGEQNDSVCVSPVKLTENLPHPQKLGEKGDLRFNRSACGRPG